MIVRAFCFVVATLFLSAGLMGCAGGSASAPVAAAPDGSAPRDLGCGPRPVAPELEPPSVSDALAASDLVFAGRMIELHDPIPLSAPVPAEDLVLDYAFEVYRVWKGPPQDTLWVRSYREPESGGMAFRQGAAFIVYAVLDSDLFWTNRCGRTGVISAATTDLYSLGDPIFDDGSGRLPHYNRETLTRQLRALAPATRLKALRTLEQIARQDPEAVAIILDAYAEQTGAARVDFVAALGRLGPAAESATPLLIETLAEDEPNLRAMAAASLGKIGLLTPKVLPALIAALEDEDSTVRGASAQALGVIGPAAAEAAPALRGVLNDPEPRVRDLAAQSLQIIGGAAR